MTDHGISTSIFVVILVVGLIGLSVWYPENRITGQAIKETDSCGDLGCTELCDFPDGACSDGMTCCFTHWETGVCDYESNCETIRELSLSQSLATYQDSIRERPAPIDAGWQRFILPILVCVAIVAYFALKRDDPEYGRK